MRYLIAIVLSALVVACGDITGPDVSTVFQRGTQGDRYTLSGDSLLRFPGSAVVDDDGNPVTYEIKITRERTLDGTQAQNTVDRRSLRTLVWNRPGVFCVRVIVDGFVIARGDGSTNVHWKTGLPFMFVNFPGGGACS